MEMLITCSLSCEQVLENTAFQAHKLILGCFTADDKKVYLCYQKEQTTAGITQDSYQQAESRHV